MFAMDHSEIVDWQTFVNQNPWAAQALEQMAGVDEQLPKQCIAVFYVIDTTARKITHQLNAVTWSSDYKFRAAFRNLNWASMERTFKVEDDDILQLENPQTIINDGGEIFFLMHNDVVTGTVALVVENGEYQATWMAVANNYLGLGFTHALLVVITNWARIRGLPGISVLTSTTLGSAVSLYQTHGFQVTHFDEHCSGARYDMSLRLCL
ncbi:hypothetical protein INT44_009295 [Umbelopsis vinacea]|uniref:N-acetyltransferase domain-containing protein n=1 Tax=Umbelopsis vinacea TaxID=44442 RepID=A0A8H7UIF2_9FUNG|nr:hypothetical protein INT44_009295 [Umbelopsis vinacea]